MNRYRNFWRRLVADVLDNIILSPLAVLNEYLEQSPDNTLWILGSVITSTIYFTYFIVLHSRYGYTLGKKVMNIKVVDIDEMTHIGTKRALIRESPWILVNVAAFLYLIIIMLFDKHSVLEKIKDKFDNFLSITSLIWMLLELITMLSNYKRRAIHDYLGRSVVVRTDRLSP